MGSSRSIASAVAALCVALTSVLALAVFLGGRDSAVRPGRGGAQRLDFAEAVCHDHDARDWPVATSSEPLGGGRTHLAGSGAPAIVRPAFSAPPALTETDGPPGKTFELVSRRQSHTPARAPPVL
ncbi:MAG: hypothetical protein AB7Q29_19400 [Vicinamibacterales bacterium]